MRWCGVRSWLVGAAGLMLVGCGAATSAPPPTAPVVSASPGVSAHELQASLDAAVAEKARLDAEAAVAAAAAEQARVEAEAAAAAEQARVLAEQQAAAAAAQPRAAPALTCYGGDVGTVVEMPCDSEYCTSIGCTRSDGMYVGYYGVYDPNTVQLRPDGIPAYVPYSDQPEAGGDYICTMECDSMSCMQYQDVYC